MENYVLIPSPLGVLQAAWNDKALTALDFVDDQVDERVALSGGSVPSFVLRFAEELEAYFFGALREFSVPLAFTGGTIFQRRVWEALREIPYGSTVTYGDLARSLGFSSGASRAVGSACGANPLPLLVPCHRVLAAGGRLGGYAGGLWRKERLLAIEQAQPR
ncbi:methylated-DNA--[protein]-cysteine S-methyltransferase [Gracilinema caldarium]|uniref:methylated-DNA--[protein]-cysteine S-methyltransferase n=1 Tax=Gracilinema caldarium TaxID=215591 RepID=UPI0026F1EC0D|nr:methylated-DNA--[protein]-cysteine S-methyltransferase [Gracilinema caldarium]